MWPQSSKAAGLRRYRKHKREKMQKMRYGVGMALGCLAVHFAKRVVRSVPVLGRLASPILGMFPTVVVGPAVGAAVVFVLDEGDIPTAAEKLKDVVRRTGTEVEAAARDLQADLHHVVKRSEEQLGRPLLPAAISNTLHSAERTVTPAVEREFRRVQEQLDRLQRERAFHQQLQAAAAGRN